MARGRPSALRCALINSRDKRDGWFQAKHINAEVSQELGRPINNIAIGHELGKMVTAGYFTRRHVREATRKYEYRRH